MTGSDAFSISLRALLAAALAVLAGCSAIRPTTHALPGDDLSVFARMGRAPATPWKEKLSDRYFFDGSVLQMQERYSEAIAQFQRVLRLTPARSEAQFAIARCYRAIGAADTALLFAREAVVLTPTNVDARLQLAELLVINGRVEEGIEQYEQVLKEQPEDVSARYDVAQLLYRRDPERAIVHYEYIRRNIGEDYDALLNLAELYLSKRAYDDAIAVMREVLDIEPANHDLYKLLGDIYLQSERYDDALAFLDDAERRILPASQFQRYLTERMNELSLYLARGPQSPGMRSYARRVAERAADRFPDQWSVTYSSGMVRYHLGDSVAADSLLGRALADKTSPVSAWSQTAELFLDGGHEARALKLLTPLPSRHNKEPHLLDLLGTLYFVTGLPDSAEKYLRASLAIEDENSQAWGRLGLLYIRQGKPGASDAAYDKALLHDPENVWVLNNFAYSLAERGRQLDRALEMIRQALDEEPENEAYLDTYGWIYFKKGEYQKALQYIQRSVDIGGASADVLAHLGDVQAALGDRDAARAAYERALRLAPDDGAITRKLEGVR